MLSWIRTKWVLKLWHLLGRTENRLRNVDAEMVALAKVRMVACSVCPFFRKEREGVYPAKTCRKCGCFMPAKVWLKNAKCPDGKW